MTAVARPVIDLVGVALYPFTVGLTVERDRHEQGQVKGAADSHERTRCG